jgi:pimeloyl-ACP methyl ester carboxylesterase
VDPRQAATAAALLPRGELRVLPQCGHAPQIERAGLVNRLVVEFLSGPGPATPGAAASEPAIAGG